MLPLSICLIWHSKPSSRHNWLMGLCWCRSWQGQSWMSRATTTQRMIWCCRSRRAPTTSRASTCRCEHAPGLCRVHAGLFWALQGWLAISSVSLSGVVGLTRAGLSCRTAREPVAGTWQVSSHGREPILTCWSAELSRIKYSGLGRLAECSLFCRMHLSEVACLPQEFNRQLQDAGADDQLTAMREIAFELAAPAGELRRQRGSGSHKVRPRCRNDSVADSPVQESGPLSEGWPWHDIL